MCFIQNASHTSHRILSPILKVNVRSSYVKTIKIKKKTTRYACFWGVDPSPQCESNYQKTVLKYTDIDNEFKKIINFKNNNNSAL